MGRPTNFLNKYTPASIFQEIEFTHKIYKRDGIVRREDVEWLSFREGDDKYLDLGLASSKVVSMERLIERRQDVYNVFSKVFSSDVVTITLGLVEAWYDEKYNSFMQFAPTRQMRKDKDRFKFCQMPYNVCLEYIRDAINLIKSENNCNLLITTSPVSLARTFTDSDVIIANAESKAILRAVCGQINREYDFVGYFPSYENAALTKKPEVYLDDNIHVSPEFVGSIISKLVSSYFSKSSEASVALQKARVLNQRGDYSGVEEVLSPFSLDQEFPIDAATLIIQVLLRQRKFEQAIEIGKLQLWKDLNVERMYSVARFYSVLNSAYLGVGDNEIALECAEKAMLAEPDEAVWAFECGNTLLRLNRPLEAEKLYRAYPDKIQTVVRKVQYFYILKANDKIEEAKNLIYPIPETNIAAGVYIQVANALSSADLRSEALDTLMNGAKIHPGDLSIETAISKLGE
ncbi:MAG: GSCFA domain-containing protein [Paracoccaceae bacterium]|nr:GSCFA domain-containing protein [Paracoccaceae bacterium]